MVRDGEQAVEAARAVILQPSSGSRLGGLVSSSTGAGNGAAGERVVGNLRWLAEHGFRCVAVQAGPDLRVHIGDGSTWDVDVSYLQGTGEVETHEGPVLLRQWLGEQPFLLLSGDVVFDFDPLALLERHATCPGLATIGLTLAASGNVEMDRAGRILRYTGGRLDPELQLRHAGCSVVEPALFDSIPRDADRQPARSVITAVLRQGGILCGCVVGNALAGSDAPASALLP